MSLSPAVRPWGGLLVVLAGCLAGCATSAPEPASKASEAELQARETRAQVRYLESLTRLRPEHWRAQVWYASLLAQEGETARSFEAVRAAVRTNPRNPHLRRVLAEAAGTAGYPDCELAAWQEAGRLDPDNPYPILRLAGIYRLLGWRPLASRALEEAGRRAPTSLEVLAERASLDALNPGARRRWADLLLRHHPERPHGYSLLADLKLAAREWDEAIRLGNEAIRRAPRDAAFRIRLAQYLLERKDPDQQSEAIRLLREARELDPEGAEPLYWLGSGLAAVGQDTEAVAVLEQARERAPQDVRVLGALAGLYSRTGRPDQARQVQQARERLVAAAQEVARSTNPLGNDVRDGAAHMRLAGTYEKAGRPAPALLEYLAARECGVSDADDGVARALRAMGREPDSLPDGLRVLEAPGGGG